MKIQLNKALISAYIESDRKSKKKPNKITQILLDVFIETCLFLF